MKEDFVIIHKSSIDGEWVFAARDFKKGEKVLHRDISKTVSKSLFQKMTKKQKDYISFVEGKYIVMQSPEKFINHSCEANTTAKNFCDVAIRDIKKWEEITGNYDEVSSDKEKIIPCTCNTKSCRVFIS